MATTNNHPTVEGMFVARGRRSAEICDAMAAQTTGSTSSLWTEYANDARLRQASMASHVEADAHAENRNRGL